MGVDEADLFWRDEAHMGLPAKIELEVSSIYKDAIELTSRWKVCFRQTFFLNEAQGRVLYKLVLVTYLLLFFVGCTALQTSSLLKK